MIIILNMKVLILSFNTKRWKWNTEAQLTKNKQKFWVLKGCHYQKSTNYRRSEFVSNAHNSSVMMFYRQTFDDKISVSKLLVNNHLPTDCSSLPVIIDRNIYRSVRRLLPTETFVVPSVITCCTKIDVWRPKL